MKQRIFLTGIISSTCFSLLFFTISFANLHGRLLRPQERLPVPKRLMVNLPDPLTLVPFSEYILGAQPIVGDDIIKYVNIQRKIVGSPPLIVNALLTQAAQMRADVILTHQNFSHQDPYEGIELTTVLPKLHYYYRYASENIGMGGSSAEDFVGGFMHSTSHRENLLNPALVQSGAAVVTGPYKEYYVNIAVQLFAIPATKAEYLGYTDEQVLSYHKLLSDLDDKLAFTRFFLDRNVGDQEYYQKWKEILQLQKNIMGEVVSVMDDGLKFNQRDVDLINEYNYNWSLPPKQPRY